MLTGRENKREGARTRDMLLTGRMSEREDAHSLDLLLRGTDRGKERGRHHIMFRRRERKKD